MNEHDFWAFLERKKVRLLGVEAGGSGKRLGEHAARFDGGSLGVLHGTRTLVLQDEEGQVANTHSVSAGLDYPAVGPEHVLLAESGRVEYTSVSDAEAVEAFHKLAQTEGILPALESAHALAEVARRAPRLSAKRILLAAVHCLHRFYEIRKVPVPGQQIEMASSRLRDVILEHGDDQLVLAVEIRVERATREAGRGRDGLDAGAADALFLEHARGRLEQLFAGIVPGRSGSDS